jgi:hypothetical protein
MKKYYFYKLKNIKKKYFVSLKKIGHFTNNYYEFKMIC